MTAVTSRASDAETLAVLNARAAVLAQPLEQQHDTTLADLLLVTVGGRPVTVPVDALREVRPPGPVAPVPAGNAVLIGIAAGHAGALVVASLAALLDLPATAAPTEQWVVVLDDPDAPVGLLVDTADEIVSVNRQDLTSSPESGALIAALAPGGALVLDPAALLRDPRLFLSPRPDATEAISWQDP